MQLNNANEKTIIHPGQEIKLKKQQPKLVPRVDIQVQQETPSDNTRVKKPILTERSLSTTSSRQNWVEQAQAYRQANPTTIQSIPEQPYQTNYWAFTGNTPTEEFSYSVMQNAKKGMQDAEKIVKSEKVKHTLYKGDPARTKQEGDKKDQIANLQRQLRQLGYYTETVDGIEGSGTRNALTAAEKDGYILQNGKLIKNQNKVKIKGVPTIPGITNEKQYTPAFDEYLYITGGSDKWNNIYDELETLIGSKLGITTESGDGAKRQMLAQMINPIKTKGRKGENINSIHYDASKRYFNRDLSELKNRGSIGQMLKDMDWHTIYNIIPANVSNFTIGQNNQTTEEKLRNGGAGWAQTSDGGYWVKDGTDYHMITVKNPNFDPNKPESDKNSKYMNVGPNNPKYQEYLDNSSFWGDIKNGIYNPATLFENAGSRNKWTGGYKETRFTPEQIQQYKNEYEQVINNPKALQQYNSLKQSLLKNLFNHT